MENDEKLLKCLDLSQARIKLIADLGIKGIILHLGITAFSMTIAFQDDKIPKPIILISNAIITALALLSTILVRNDFKNAFSTICSYYKILGIEINTNEFNGLILAAKLYGWVCSILILFWIWLLFSFIK